MSNDQMKPNRFLRWHMARRMYAAITQAIAEGYRVQVTTYTTSRIYANLDQFRCTKSSVYSQRGRQWDCIDGASVRFVA